MMDLVTISCVSVCAYDVAPGGSLASVCYE